MSEIDNSRQPSAQEQMTKSEQLIHFINKFRFKNSNITKRLIQTITEQTNKDSKTIELKSLNKVIHYGEEDILSRLQRYLQDIDIVNQILPDFTYSKQLSDYFVKKYGAQIEENSCLFSQQGPDFISSFESIFHTSYFYGYYLQDVTLDDMESLLIQMLIDEFIILNQNQPVKKNDNLLIEFNPQNAPEQLGLLSNLYNVICVHLTDAAEAEGNKRYNVYILLIYTEAYERIDTPARTAGLMRKTLEGKTLFF